MVIPDTHADWRFAKNVRTNSFLKGDELRLFTGFLLAPGHWAALRSLLRGCPVAHSGGF
jgi:hypothetical protein